MTTQVFSSIKTRIASFFGWNAEETSKMTAAEVDDKLQAETATIQEWKNEVKAELSKEASAGLEEMKGTVATLTAAVDEMKTKAQTAGEEVAKLTEEVTALSEENKNLSASKTTLEKELAKLKGAAPHGKGKGKDDFKVKTPEEQFSANYSGFRKAFPEDEEG